MSHSLIVGMTESGKTSLSRKLASTLRSKGYGVLVYSPIDNSGWDCDILTGSIPEFLDHVKKSRYCMIFIDEADMLFRDDPVSKLWLGTRSRHLGHSVFFITQRPQLLPVTVRGQCKNLFLFNCSADDAKKLSNEWNKIELREAHTLTQGEYFHIPKMGTLSRNKLW